MDFYPQERAAAVRMLAGAFAFMSVHREAPRSVGLEFHRFWLARPDDERAIVSLEMHRHGPVGRPGDPDLSLVRHD